MERQRKSLARRKKRGSGIGAVACRCMISNMLIINAPCTESPRFKKFVKSCVDAYDILRENARLLIALFAMMLSTGIPEVCMLL